MKVDSEAVHIHIDCSMTYPKSNRNKYKNYIEFFYITSLL